MTTYIKRSEIAKTRSRMKEIARQGVECVPDPFAAVNFARECMPGKELDALSLPAAGDVGILALALAGLTLKTVRESCGIEKKDSDAALDALLSLFDLTLPLEMRKINGALKDLVRLAPIYRGYASEQHKVLKAKLKAAGRQKHNHLAEDEHEGQLFARSLARYQFGYDGHWMTRETAARLKLVRYFEKTSGAFASRVRTCYMLLARQGRAYAAWNSGYPVFLCDLNVPEHLAAAISLYDAAHGEIVVISRAPGVEIRPKLPSYMLVIDDEQGLFEWITQNSGTVLLLERRLGGWTVTFPGGRVNPKEVKKKSHPAIALALARCAPKTKGEEDALLESEARRIRQRKEFNADQALTNTACALQAKATSCELQEDCRS